NFFFVQSFDALKFSFCQLQMHLALFVLSFGFGQCFGSLKIFVIDLLLALFMSLGYAQFAFRLNQFSLQTAYLMAVDDAMHVARLYFITLIDLNFKHAT